MSDEPASMIEVPRITLYGAGDQRRIRPFSFEGRMGTDYTDRGKQYHRLHKGSITLGDEATLYQAYLASACGQAPALPRPVRTVLYRLFGQMGSGNVTDDACDYDHGERLRKVRETDRSVRWIVHPDGFEQGAHGWEARVGADSEVHYILVPKSGYVEMTVDGAYHPGLGVPFATLPRREAAIKSWIDKGFDPGFATNAVSYFYSRAEGQGTSPVVRSCDNEIATGRFTIIANSAPDYAYRSVGSFPASRAAGGLSGEGYEGGRIGVIPPSGYRCI